MPGSLYEKKTKNTLRTEKDRDGTSVLLEKVEKNNSLNCLGFLLSLSLIFFLIEKGDGKSLQTLQTSES